MNVEVYSGKQKPEPCLVSNIAKDDVVLSLVKPLYDSYRYINSSQAKL